MNVLIINFQLRDLDEFDYRSMTEAVAPQIAQMPGLVGKAFLADPQSNTYGGVYFFENRQAVEHYLASEIIQALRSSPHIINYSVRGFDTIPASTKITQGRLPLYPIEATV